MRFQAGVGRAIITPPLSAPHASWGAQTHVFAEGVDADLWSTVLLVDDGHEQAAFVDIDLCLFTPEEADGIRAEVAAAIGVDKEHIRVAPTHNHAGPPPSSYTWVKEGHAALERYYALLPAQCAGAARLAKRNLKPARVAVGAGESRVAMNRRQTGPDGRTLSGSNAGGIMDPHVFVLRIDSMDRSPLAAVVGYTMHPTTLGPTNKRISPDWPGHLKRTVEALTGATCLFVQGATGNVGPGPEGFTDDIRVARKLGTLVGCEAARVYLSLHLPPVEYHFDRVWESGAPLGKWGQVQVPEPITAVRARSHEVRVPLRTQPAPSEARVQLQEAEARLHRLKRDGAAPGEIEAATFATKRANMALTRAETFASRTEFPLELHVLQVGPAVFAGLPIEPFVETGLAIKAASPFPHTWFGGYSGAWYGYMPIASEFSRGGYEVDTSPFAPEAAGKVADATVEALNELHAETASAGGQQ
jgi:Neutral/alkaline non-lysosomal ceramidase, N-terminal